METATLDELSLVALKSALPDAKLEAGDVGTIVHVYDGGVAYKVEFVAADGRTLAVETLSSDQVEPFAGSQILHARKLARA